MRETINSFWRFIVDGLGGAAMLWRRFVLFIVLTIALTAGSLFQAAYAFNAWRTTFYVQSEYMMTETGPFYPGERLPFVFYRQSNYVGRVDVVRVLYRVIEQNGTQIRQRVRNDSFMQIIDGKEDKQWFGSGTLLPDDLPPGKYIYMFDSRVEFSGGWFRSATTGTPVFEVAAKQQ